MSDSADEGAGEEADVPTLDDVDNTDVFTNTITNPRFNEWYNERQVTANILSGQIYFNGLSSPPDPERHSPSKLLQCHRKIAYRQENAPREGGAPEGLFWAGERFEEDVMVPFLQDVATDDDTYVQNSKWIDVSIDVDGTEIRLKGVTDPVIVTEDGTPLLVTEIKTKRSLDNLTKPNPHHRAQLHAYLYALNEEYDRPVNTGLLIYGSRTTFDIEVFTVTFDPEFWSSVVEWMADHTEYRERADLPPATPEMEWECNLCSFKHRCGQTDVPYEDVGYEGLLPDFDGYRKQQVRDYLEADPDAKLTPTLAAEYPELAEDFNVKSWVCPECDHTKAWTKGTSPDGQPICPNCAKNRDSLITMVVDIDSEQ